MLYFTFYVGVVLCTSAMVTIVEPFAPNCSEESVAKATNISVALVTTNLTQLKMNLDVMYHISDYSDGFLLFRGGSVNGTETCYRIIPIMVELSDTGYSNVYDTAVRRTLSPAVMVVGAYLKSVRGYSDTHKKLYFLSTPLPYNYYEGKQYLMENVQSRIISVWPSYYMFAHALRLFVDLRMSNQGHDQRVLILTHTTTADGLEYVSLLENVTRDINFRTVYTHDLWRAVEQMKMDKQCLKKSQSYHADMTKLKKKLKDDRIKMIIVYLEMSDEMTLDQKMKVYESLFSEGADLEEKGVPWLIADMSLPFQPGALQRLRKLPVKKTQVFLPVVWGTYLPEIAQSVLNGLGEELLSHGMEGFGLMQSCKILEKVVASISPDMLQKAVRTLGMEAVANAFNETINQFIKTKDTVDDAPDSLEMKGYPRNVVMTFSRIAPQIDNYCQEIRAVFGRPETLKKIFTSSYRPTDCYTTHEIAYRTTADYQIAGIKPPPDQQEKAVVVLDKPFALRRRDGTFEGIAIDIYKDINNILMSEGIFLNLELIAANNYGRKFGNSWTGALGKIHNDTETKMAIGQFSITPERQKDFAYTSGIGYIGYTFIVRKSIKYNNYLQFTKPFNSEVWSCLCLAMVLGAIYIFIVDLWNPFESDIENKFTLKESIWYSYLTINQTGPPFGAYTYPTRTFSMFYWFFALVVVACYTGNLASFLTESAMENPKINVDKLNLSELNIRYGMVKGSSVIDYLESTRLDFDVNLLIKRGDLVNTYEEGIQRARNESFILFGTSTVLKYHENHDPDCYLTMHQTPFYSRGIHEIAFVMDKNWEYAADVTRAMDMIRESGRLQRIYHRWVNFAGDCSVPDDDGDHVSLAPHHFYGIFVLLAVSVVVSFFFLAIKLVHLKLKEMNEAGDDRDGSATPTPEQVPLTNTSDGAQGTEPTPADSVV